MLTQITAPWTPWFRCTFRPTWPIEQTATTLQEAIKFRQTVK